MLKFLKYKKESLLSNGVKHLISTYLEQKNLGEITDFSLNSKKRDIHLTLLLRKENEPFQIVITNYNFIRKGELAYFTFDSIKTSRDWNSTTLEKIIGSEDKKINVPKRYVKVIEMFL
jgi:sporulation protein YlmC with PRC-barrel domain